MNTEAYLAANKVTAWNTGAQYSEHGQRIACIELPNQLYYFYDLDRSIDGITSMSITSQYINAKEFVNQAYLYGHYTPGSYAMSKYEGWDWQDVDALVKAVINAAKEVK